MFNWGNINNDFIANISVLLLVIWEAFWKVMALWKAAKAGDKLWFVAIFVVNFFGLIPIFYLWRSKQLEEVLKDFQHFFKSKFKKN